MKGSAVRVRASAFEASFGACETALAPRPGHESRSDVLAESIRRSIDKRGFRLLIEATGLHLRAADRGDTAERQHGQPAKVLQTASRWWQRLYRSHPRLPARAKPRQRRH